MLRRQRVADVWRALRSPDTESHDAQHGEPRHLQHLIEGTKWVVEPSISLDGATTTSPSAAIIDSSLGPSAWTILILVGIEPSVAFSVTLKRMLVTPTAARPGGV